MTNRFQPIKSIRGDTIKAEDLRASILQAAVQGKLVPQDPDDEPAEELVKRIRAEKQRLIREGKIKKERNVSEIHRRDGHWYETIDGKDERCIDDEIQFEIPESWMWVRLGNIGRWKAGSTPSKQVPGYYRDGTIPWLKTGDLCNSHINYVPGRITNKALDDCSLELIPVNSVLVAMYGATIGKVGINDIALTTNQACCACTLLLDLNSEYLFWFIQSQVSYIRQLSLGGAQPNISKDILTKILFPLPSVNEQKRIVEKIDSLIPLIERYGQIDSEYSSLIESIPGDLRASILQAAVQGRLVPQDPNDEPAEELVKRIRAEKQRLIKEGKIKKERNVSEIHRRDGHWYETIDGKDERCIDDEIPFEIPDSWTWCRGSTCFSKMESRHPDSDYFDYIDIDAIDNNHCVVTSPKRILASQAPSRASRAVHEGDVLFSMVRPYLRNIAIIDRSLQDSIASTGFYVCSPYPYLHSRFLFWMLISNYVIDGLTEFMKGNNSPSIKNSDIESFLFVIPPINEQKRIVEKIDSLSPLIERYGKVTSQFTSLPYDSKPKEDTE